MATIEQVLSPEAIRTANEKPQHPLYDARGNPIQVGNTDPNVLGPDDAVPKVGLRGIRDRSKYSKLYPDALFVAEEHYVLPMAAYVAEKICEVDLMDELTHRMILVQLKQNNMMAVLDISNPEIRENIITWGGFKVYVRDFAVVTVMFRLDTTIQICTIPYLRVWQNAVSKYAIVGDPSMISNISREDTATIIANYFRNEGILR